MTDQQIIDRLIARDRRVTEKFFFNDCRPLFTSIIRQVFTFNVDYDEFVNEFYLHLMEDDAHRLRQFQGRSTIYQWLKVVAIRYFIGKRNRVIDIDPKDALIDSPAHEEAVDEENGTTARIDIERLFSLMSNSRYKYVIRRLIIQDADPKDVAKELNINVDNLYNIKKRAMATLTEIALKDIEKYERRIY